MLADPARPWRRRFSRKVLTRRWLRHRRLIAATLAGCALLVGLESLRPPGAATVEVVTAATEIPAGTRLQAKHLATRAYPPALVPRGATQADDAATLVGARASLALRPGEALTDVRLLSAGALAALPERHRAVPVQVPVAIATMLAVGDRVDVLAASSTGGLEPDAPRPQVPVTALARGALVLLVAGAGAGMAATETVVLAIPVGLADTVAVAGTAAVTLTIDPR